MSVNPVDPPAAPAKRTLLVVEPSGEARSVLSRRLLPFGWECLLHATVESALEDRELRFTEAVLTELAFGEGRLSGIDLIPALRAEGVGAPVVLMSSPCDKQRLKAALNAGASYFVEKPFTTESLRAVLEKVTAVDVNLLSLINRTLARARLTRKEEQAARLVLKGIGSAEVAQVMGNSEKTVKQHLTQVYSKLSVSGRAGFFHLIFPT